MNTTHEELLRLVEYDPATGVFVALTRRGKLKPGSVLGWLRNGYPTLAVNYYETGAHRWAWFYMTGAWPEHEVDHRDRNPAHNWWSNLRAATHKQNLENQVSNRAASGHQGVYMNRGRYVARIKHRGRFIYLGTYDDIADAIHVRGAAERLFFTHARPELLPC